MLTILLFLSLMLADLYLTASALPSLSRHRAKRQTRSDYRSPYGIGSDRYPGRDSSNLSPVFPFVHSFGTGILVEPGDDTAVDGFINVPIPSWGLFDFGGNIEVGQTPFAFNWGHLVAPVNPLGIEPETLAQLTNDPNFLQARATADTVPAIQLPDGFSPLNCKPPLCNPFTGSLGFGAELDTGGDPTVNGALDFPIPAGANGLGVRFPLSGGISSGSSNVQVKYGQNISPVDALGGLEADARAREQADRDAAARSFFADSLRMRELVQQLPQPNNNVVAPSFGAFPPIPNTKR